MTFRPSILATVALALLAAGFSGLGVWQLQRADWKAGLLEAYEQAPQRSLADALAEGQPFADVRATGRYLGERHLLLDNQIQNGTLGVFVFTPFQSAAGDTLLINRGWLAWPRPRSEPPEIATPDGTVTVSGRLREPPRPGLYLGEAQALSKTDWPQVVTYLNTDRASEALGVSLPDWIVQLNADVTHGFGARDWPVVNFGPARHLGYAYTWFTMVLTIIIIWIILGVLRARRIKQT